MDFQNWKTQQRQLSVYPNINKGQFGQISVRKVFPETIETHEELSKLWKQIEYGAESIYSQKSISQDDYMKLYSCIYNYCTGSTGHSISRFPRNYLVLYENLEGFICRHLMTLRTNISNDLTSEEVMNFYVKNYQDFSFSSKVLNGVCSYFNRYCIHHEHNSENISVHEIYELAQLCWQKTLFAKMGETVTTALLSIIEKERLGEEISETSAFTVVINSYLELGRISTANSSPDGRLGIYQETFENRFLKETERFYTKEANESTSLRNNDTNSYFKKVRRSLLKEENLVSKFLHHSTLSKVQVLFHRIMVEEQMEYFINEWINILVNGQQEDVEIFYFLISRVATCYVETIAAMFGMEVGRQMFIAFQDLVEAMLTSKSKTLDPQAFVEAFFNVYNKYSNLLKNTFQSSPIFSSAFSEAIFEGLNNNAITSHFKNENKSAELIAHGFDVILRNKKFAEDIENSLDDMMQMFSYLRNKDVFHEFYFVYFADRLKKPLFLNVDYEENMFHRLSLTSGSASVFKLTRIWADMTLSRDLNKEFKTSVQNQSERSSIVNSYFSVFTHAFWPFRTTESFEIPFELVPVVTLFKTFYCSKYRGRKLSDWQYTGCYGELVATKDCFKNRKNYVFQMSVYQMGVLLLFNEHHQMDIQGMMKATKLSFKTISQIVDRLLGSTLLRIVEVNAEDIQKKNGESLSYTEETKFCISPDYDNEKHRVNINIRPHSDNTIEDSISVGTIEENRVHVIQAAIVRIMKFRRTLAHERLLNEVVEKLSPIFKPSVSSIKKCIQVLIDKEYMERTSGDLMEYNYKA